ncbi:DinB family protein [Paenibacillus sp. R14(2021)]|uniref:DinB family protein n=1 Tax=Paenibacillus sp. R14(2021) TaxID=2859228 RepID=UPI001C6131F0|nr:DinB family protein [Paenibacillus sp. R14(2021)]
MRDTYVLDMLDRNHSRLLKLAEACSEDERNAVPEGFNNNIHWNIGHVLTVTERLVFEITGQTMAISDDYLTFFRSGTKPAEWQGEPPAWDVIMTQLREQPDRIRELLKDSLHVTVKENFAKAETVDELIAAALLHEVMHSSTISAMLKVLK